MDNGIIIKEYSLLRAVTKTSDSRLRKSGARDQKFWLVWFSLVLHADFRTSL
jgi:hypothetical protein